MARSRQSIFKRLFTFRYLFLINGVIIILLSLSLGREMVRNMDIQGEISDLQTQAQDLASRNLYLQELQTAMQTESFIEREARLKLGLQMPGESVVIIQDEVEVLEGLEGVEAASALEEAILKIESQAVEVEQLANPLKWWYYFFNKNRFQQIAMYE